MATLRPDTFSALDHLSPSDPTLSWCPGVLTSRMCCRTMSSTASSMAAHVVRCRCGLGLFVEPGVDKHSVQNQD